MLTRVWKHHVYEQGFISNPGIACLKGCEEETKTVLTTFNKKKATCKTQNFYILLAL